MSKWQWPGDSYVHVGEHRDHDTVTKKVKSKRIWARRGGRENEAFAGGFAHELLPGPWELEKRNALLDVQW